MNTPLELKTLKELENSQLYDQVTIIEAVAGCGKTYRLKRLVEHAKNIWGIKQNEILFVTFSSSLAKELDLEIDDNGKASTLHAFGRKLIEQNFGFFGFERVPNLGKEAVLQRCLGEAAQAAQGKLVEAKQKKFFKLYEEKGYSTSKIIQDLKVYQKNGLTLIEKYSEIKRNLNIISYGDMIRLGTQVCRELSKQNNVYFEAPKLFCVDEFQDMNWAEKQFILTITELASTTVITGNDRQGIYKELRGAFNEALAQLAREHPDWKFYTVQKSRRLTKQTAALVNACSNDKKYPNIIGSRNGPKPLFVECSKKEDALKETARLIQGLIQKGVDPNQIAIITRFRKDYQQASLFLSKFNIQIGFSEAPKEDFEILTKFLDFAKAALDAKNKKLFNFLQKHLHLTDQQETQMILELQGMISGKRLDVGEGNREDAKRVINSVLDVRENFCFDKLKRAFKENVQGDIHSKYNLAIGNVLERYGLIGKKEVEVRGLLQRVQSLLKVKSRSGVRVSTIHAAKGKTFQHIFLIDVFDLNLAWSEDVFDVNEESKIFHVAMTRSKERLYLMFFHRHGRILADETLEKREIDDCKLIRFLPSIDLIPKYCEMKVV